MLEDSAAASRAIIPCTLAIGDAEQHIGAGAVLPVDVWLLIVTLCLIDLCMHDGSGRGRPAIVAHALAFASSSAAHQVFDCKSVIVRICRIDCSETLIDARRRPLHQALHLLRLLAVWWRAVLRQR